MNPVKAAITACLAALLTTAASAAPQTIDLTFRVVNLNEGDGFEAHNPTYEGDLTIRLSFDSTDQPIGEFNGRKSYDANATIRSSDLPVTVTIDEIAGIQLIRTDAAADEINFVIYNLSIAGQEGFGFFPRRWNAPDYFSNNPHALGFAETLPAQSELFEMTNSGSNAVSVPRDSIFPISSFSVVVLTSAVVNADAPAPISADLNTDGTVNVFDLIAFLQAFSAALN